MPITDDVPLESACLIGCGVLTGVGSVFNRTELGSATPRRSSASAGSASTSSRRARSRARAGSSPIDTVADKEKWAREFGATDFVLAGEGVDTVQAVRELLPFSDAQVTGVMGAGGVDYAFDCVGHPAVLNNALEMLDWGGTAVIIGVPPPTATVPSAHRQLHPRRAHPHRVAGRIAPARTPTSR